MARNQPICEHMLEKPHNSNTNVWRDRQRRARELGIDPYQCGYPATHRIGKTNYCKHHAGARLLSMAEDGIYDSLKKYRK